MDEEHGPAETEVEALLYAVESHSGQERFGNPYGGGYLEQSVLWRLAVECVARAISDAKRDASDFAS